MKNQFRILLLAIFIYMTHLFLFTVPCEADVSSYIEDFTTKQYKDTLNTTACWDTVAGELKLPLFKLALAGSYDTPGQAQGIALAGDYAYVADYGSGLQVFDISDPTNPILAGNYDTPGRAHGVTLAGDYAYVAALEGGFHVIDISDPTNPTSAGGYPVPDHTRNIAISGNYAYVVNGLGLWVLDISYPTNPSFVDSVLTPGLAYEVTISGDYVYVADGDAGLQVIDVSDPTNPVSAGNCDTPVNALEVAIFGDSALIADSYSGLQVIDITDPTNPTLIGSYDTEEAVGVDITGDYAYVADGGSGIKAIDISDPMNPVLVDSLDTPDFAYNLLVSGEYAYVADNHSGLQVIKIAEPVIPPILAGSNDIGYGLDVTVSGNYVFKSCGTAGIQVIDISDPASPTIVDIWSTHYAQRVAVAGDYAYVADATEGLKVIDISDPYTLSLAGWCDVPGSAGGIAISGNYAYIAAGDSGLQVIDISVTTTPTLVGGNYDVPGISTVAVSGDYAYVTDGYGFYVIDISDPVNPILLGSHGTPGHARGIAISGDYAYVADGVSGLEVFDISDPQNPDLVGNCDTGGNVKDIAISGDYAFLAAYHTGIYVIDISDPTTPTQLGGLDTDHAYDVATSGDYAIVADGPAGLKVIQVFERSLDLGKNTGQSTVISGENEDILKVKLTASQTDSVRWEVSADSGLHWEEVLPNNEWYDLNYPGNSLLWRSTHFYVDYGINPTCTSLEIDWIYELLYYFPVIDSILDVPNDQGRQVRIMWTRSILDEIGSPTPITEYAIFRKIDWELESIIPQTETMNKDGNPAKLPDSKQKLLAYPPGDWDFIKTIPAYCEDYYSTMVPTLADSTKTEGMYYTTFFIRASTGTPSGYYDSPPDSGYSLDNLEPCVPQGLAGQQVAEGLKITWHPNKEEDFCYYALYRGAEQGFIPSTENLLTVITDTIAIDPSWYPGPEFYYKLSAFDFSGNESGWALLIPDNIIATLLQSFSASFKELCIEVTWSLVEYDGGMEFYILRTEIPGEEFKELEKSNISRKGLVFTFKDRIHELGMTYRYRVEISDEIGRRILFETNPISTPALPLTLFQNHPNPFNPSTTIRYYLPERSWVRLNIYDVTGKQIACLVDKEQDKGLHIVKWIGHDDNGNSIASGVYFYRLIAGKEMISRKMVLLK